MIANIALAIAVHCFDRNIRSYSYKEKNMDNSLFAIPIAIIIIIIICILCIPLSPPLTADQDEVAIAHSFGIVSHNSPDTRKGREGRSRCSWTSRCLFRILHRVICKFLHIRQAMDTTGRERTVLISFL